MLGFLSRSRPLLFAITSSILARNLPLQEAFARSLSWLSALVTDKPVFPEQPHVNWMLRKVQFHVAAVNTDKNVMAIADRLDRETTTEFLGEQYQVPRLLSLLALVLAFQVQFPPEKLLQFVDEIDQLYSALAIRIDGLGKAIREVSENLMRAAGADTTLPTVLFGFVSIRCDGSKYLAETLAELRGAR